MLNKFKLHRVKIGKAKLPKIKSPIFPEDLFASDDVNRILEDLQKIKPSIKNLVVLWQDKGTPYFEISKDTLESTAVWMLESAKFDLLNGD